MEQQAASALAVFMVADVRGYTAYTHSRGDEAAAHLASLFAGIAERCAQAHGGRVVEVRGDEILAVFPSARQALRAAIALQASCAEVCSEDVPLRVGIGLEVGEPVPVGSGYRGQALNVAARLCGLAGPGEILASDALVALTRALEGVVFERRDPARLKGIPAPVQVWSVRDRSVAPATASGAPRAVEHASPTTRLNRPAGLGEIIGRSEELAEIALLLQAPDRRLLTLTGPGGVGKTRLALAAAERVLGTAAAAFVDLSAVRDPNAVPSEVARSLGIPERPGRALSAVVIDALRDHEMLLVLDNFEQLLDAAEFVASVLDASPRVRIIVTSRQPLRVRAEHVLAVGPLPLPGESGEQLETNPAVALFVERARASGAAVRRDDLAAVAEMCRRLDGLPLAIELAAARARHLPPRTLLARLDRVLPLLAHGARDVPERQRTLTAAIAWSYDLLGERERATFRRVAVFAGGCSVEAAAAVAAPPAPSEAEVLESLSALTDHSLLQVEESSPGEVRYRPLETIREFAYERSRESGELATTRSKHAVYYLGLAERAIPHLEGPEQSVWLERLERERADIASALQWSAERGDVARAIRVAADLWPFWFMRGALTEGRQLLAGLLVPGGVRIDPLLRAAGLNAAGTLARYQRDYGVADAFITEALAIRRAAGDAKAIADSLSNLGYVTLHRGDHLRARSFYEEALATYRATGHDQGIADALSHLALIALHEGSVAEARRLHQESLAIWCRLGDIQGVAWALDGLGKVELEAGDREAAHAALREGLEAARELGHGWAIALLIDGFACLAAAHGRTLRALRLAGAAAALRRQVGTPLTPFAERTLHRWLERARLAAGRVRAEEASVQGAALPIDAAIAEAFASAAPDEPQADEEARWAGLSKREREVASLVAEGLTNRQIAERLFIAEGTADRHIANILGKLDMRSRAQVAVWAAARGLLSSASERQ